MEPTGSVLNRRGEVPALQRAHNPFTLTPMKHKSSGIFPAGVAPTALEAYCEDLPQKQWDFPHAGHKLPFTAGIPCCQTSLNGETRSSAFLQERPINRCKQQFLCVTCHSGNSSVSRQATVAPQAIITRPYAVTDRLWMPNTLVKVPEVPANNF